MLTLSRKMGECLLFTLPDGRTIWLRIWKGNYRKADEVKVSIDAPSDVRIMREEIADRESTARRTLGTDGGTPTGV